MLPLIGRSSEVERLSAVLVRVEAGHGLVVAVSGESGVGKSRLAQEFGVLAGTRGYCVLTGASGRYEQDLSFGPLLHALRPLIDTGDRAERAELIGGLPDLGRLFDGVPPAPAGTGDPSLERTRLFEAVSRLVQRAASRRPVLLVIDDLQWADPSTLDVLQYLALGAAEHPCAIAVTYRTGEADEAMRRFRAPLRRLDQLVDLPVPPLDRHDVAAMAGAVLAGEPPIPLVDLLVTRAQGVPLYVTALIAALREQGRLLRSGGRWVLGPGEDAALSAGVVEVVAARLDELAPRDRHILEAVSVCGRAATFDFLKAVVDQESGPELAAGLTRLREVGLVTEDLNAGDVVHQVQHPVVAEVAHGWLSARERQRRNAAAAEFLSSHPPIDQSRLAHHVRLAGAAFDRERALDILAAAAAVAVGRRGGTEGLLHGRAALELARAAGRDDLLAGISDIVAQAATLAGDAATAMSAWREAADAHHADPVARSRCLRRLANLEWDAGDLHAAESRLDEARTALGDKGAADERLRVLQLQVVMRGRRGRPDQTRADLIALRDLASEVGHRGQAALVERYLNDDRVMNSVTMPAPAKYVERAFEESDELALVASWQRPWIVDAIARGDPAEARRRAREGRRLGRAAEVPSLEVAPVALEALAEFLAGDWDRALALADEALVLAHQVNTKRGISLSLTMRSLLFVHRGALDEAQECVAEARSIFGSGDRHLIGGVETVATLIALAKGEVSTAVAFAQAAGSVNNLTLLTLQARAEAYRAAGDDAAAIQTAAEIAAVDGPWAVALAGRIRGLNIATPSVAGPLLTAAASAFDRLGMPFEAASCRLEHVEMLARHDSATVDPAAVTPELPHLLDSAVDANAVDALEKVLAVFDRLGAAPSADRARRVLRRFGRRPAPRPRLGWVLSDREIEVAMLVAQGLSNAAVASQLFLSTRTVTTHLDRIYRRLGIASRTDLAHYLGQHPSITQSRGAVT